MRPTREAISCPMGCMMKTAAIMRARDLRAANLMRLVCVLEGKFDLFCSLVSRLEIGRLLGTYSAVMTALKGYSAPMPTPTKNRQNIIHDRMDMELLYPAELCATPRVPKMTTISSKPYSFLRPYLSARNPKISCPRHEPTSVTILILDSLPVLSLDQ